MPATKNETKPTETKPTEKKETAREYKARVKAALATLVQKIGAAEELLDKARRQETVYALRIGGWLNEAEQYFVDENGAYDGPALIEWAMREFNYAQNTVYDYKQAARFLANHPTAKPIVKAVDSAIVLDRFSKKNPDKLADVLGRAKQGSTAKELRSIIEEVAPKPVPTKKEQNESVAKELKGIKDKIRVKTLNRFAQYAGMHPTEAWQKAMQDGATFGAVHGPLAMVAIRELAKEFNSALASIDEENEQ